MSKLFGTDGIRGIANQYPMTCEVALSLGRALGQKYCNQHKKVVIGKDTRLSSYMFEMVVAAGVCSSGCDALLLGPVPTPAVAFLTRDMRADAGIVVSASHNPYYYNGIKIFGRDGFKLCREEEKELEAYMSQNLPAKQNVGKMFKIDDARGRYNAFLKSVFPSTYDLSGFKIAIDCANGASYKIAPKVLEELGAQIFPIGISPNGININNKCGSTHTNALRDVVLRYGCDLGIALDGDADRVIIIDEMGQVLDGDIILAIISKVFFGQNFIVDKSVVCTVMSNYGLDEYLKGNDIKSVRADVGDINVIEEMRKHGHRLGGEQSGHIIMLDHSTTGDGMVAALNVLAGMLKYNKKVSELVEMKRFPQCIINIEVKEKNDLCEATKAAINKAECTLGASGRVLVRYSGTEPKLRIMVEGKDLSQIEQLAKNIAQTVEQNV